MNCKIPVKGPRGATCNTPIYLHQEGDGKYDVFMCGVHGLISVLKWRYNR